MPTMRDQALDARAIVGPGGRTMLVPLRYGDPYAGSAEGGIGQVDLQTGAYSIAEFTIPSTERYGYRFGGSPNGQRVAVCTRWRDGEIDWSVTPPGLPITYTGLYLASFDGSPAEELEVLAGYSPGGEVDDLAVQWSPDGSSVAWSLHGPSGESETRVYDVDRGNELARVAGAMCGSASWGPDSDCLLLNVGLDETWVHDLVQDTRSAVSVLPARGDRDLRPIRALGLADRDHIVTVRQTDLRLSIAVVDLTTGGSRELLAYSELEARYPIIAAMPSGTWTAVEGEH